MEGTAAAAWIGSCFSHCPEIRVTFLQSRIAARAAPASQPALTRPNSLAFAYRSTRFNDVGRRPRPSFRGTTTVSNFPIAFWPRRRKLWAGPKPWGQSWGIPRRVHATSFVSLPRNISEYQFLRARFVSSRFVLSSCLPSFLPSFLILWLIEFRVGAAADRFPPLKPIRQSGSQFPHRGNYLQVKPAPSRGHGEVSVSLSVI